jgi:cysteine desulfurase/selenocysteine lyase
MDAAKVRKDFPVLSKEIGGRLPIYFDSACQTLRPRQVVAAMNEYYDSFPACAGRSVHKMATEVSLRIDGVRARVAQFLGADTPTEIAFLKNTTEGLNTVIFGSGLRKGDEVVTTDFEHNSMHVPLLQLADTVGIRRRILPSSTDGTFDLDAFEKAMSKKVKLVAMCLTSNVTGYTLPAKEVVEIAHSHGAKVLFDAAQAAPSHKLDVGGLEVDYLACSAHKMCGPSGIGIFYVRSDLSEQLSPLMYGGHGISEANYVSFKLLPAPERFETGLQNYSGIIGTGAAVEYLDSIGMSEIRAHEIALNKQMTKELKEVKGLTILRPSDPNVRDGMFAFNLSGLMAHDIAMILDNSKNIMMRSGMLCCHSFFHARNLDGCARASVYLYNTKEEVMVFVDSVRKLADEFSKRR